MKSMILYGSHYGSARCYAQKLSEQTGIPAFSYRDAQKPFDLGTIVYLGGLYAGSVPGLKKTLRGLSLQAGQKLVIVTVGLANPEIPKNRENIRRSLQKQLSAGLFETAKIFYLRGALDYPKLSLQHRAMMAMLHRCLKNKPVAQWSDEDRLLMETYGKQVDFVDFDALQPIIEELQSDAE